MRYNDLNSSLQSHVNTLRMIIGVLVLLILMLWFGWHSSRSDIRIHIPPDIRSGAVLKPNAISPPNVYAFAGYIFQQLNHWAKDGEKDYGRQIFRMSAYVTPDYLEYLQNDLDIRGKKGELSRRIRIIQPLPGQGYEDRRVDILNESTWRVWLDFHIQEYVRGMEVKNIKIRYPLRVVRFNVDPETNPWGLALDGFGQGGPTRLTEEDLTNKDQESAPSNQNPTPGNAQ
jgi:integrating conjugative element protein (TIGR03746 family)